MPEDTAPDTTDVETHEVDSAPEWKPPASQAEFDRIIADRLTRATKRFKDYDTLREKAARADALDHELSSETEKAAKNARDEASKAARDTFVPRLVKAEFRSEARAVGVTNEQLDALLEDVDLGRYVDDDGEPDLDRIKRKIAAIAPREPERPNFPDLGGGKRGASPSAVSMNDLIRAASGRG